MKSIENAGSFLLKQGMKLLNTADDFASRKRQEKRKPNSASETARRNKAFADDVRDLLYFYRDEADNAHEAHTSRDEVHRQFWYGQTLAYTRAASVLDKVLTRHNERIEDVYEG